MKKHNAPIEQLKQAGIEAQRKLAERGMAMYESFIEQIQKEHPDLILPGIPTYIPRKETIPMCQNILCDILQMWHAKKTDDVKEKENISKFIEFTILYLNHLEEIAQKKKRMMPRLMKELEDIPVLGKVFEPIKQIDVIRTMRQFFVDSFAISIIVNGEVHSTSSYVAWFIKWTKQMSIAWETYGKKGTEKINK